MAEYLDIDIECPDRTEFDDKEEYEAALEEYQEELETELEDWSYVDTAIYDSGDLDRIKERFGVSNKKREYDEEIEWESENDYLSYMLTLHYDEDDVLCDITNLQAEGMQWDGIRSSSFGGAYPDPEEVIQYLAEWFEDSEEE